MNTHIYSLNPTCTQPRGVGKSVKDKWYVYFYYTNSNGTRKSFKIYKDLNNKNQDLNQRKKLLSETVAKFDELLKTKRFDIETGIFIKTVSEQVLVNDLIEDYLKFKKDIISHYTYINYTSIFNRLKLSTKGLTLSQIDQQFIKEFLKKTSAKPQSKRVIEPTYLASSIG